MYLPLPRRRIYIKYHMLLQIVFKNRLHCFYSVQYSFCNRIVPLISSKDQRINKFSIFYLGCGQGGVGCWSVIICSDYVQPAVAYFDDHDNTLSALVFCPDLDYARFYQSVWTSEHKYEVTDCYQCDDVMGMSCDSLTYLNMMLPLSTKVLTHSTIPIRCKYWLPLKFTIL